MIGNNQKKHFKNFNFLKLIIFFSAFFCGKTGGRKKNILMQILDFLNFIFKRTSLIGALICFVHTRQLTLRPYFHLRYFSKKELHVRNQYLILGRMRYFLLLKNDFYFSRAIWYLCGIPGPSKIFLVWTLLNRAWLDEKFDADSEYNIHFTLKLIFSGHRLEIPAPLLTFLL
jgi:hypothetical protein